MILQGPVAALPVVYRTSEKEPTYHLLTVPGTGRYFVIIWQEDDIWLKWLLYII